MKTIKTIGVVGAGTMGAALAQKFAQEGFRVWLADRELQYVEKGLKNICSMLDAGVEKRVFTDEQVQQYISNITGTSSLEELNSCDIIIEAIFEDLAAKKELFRQLCELVPTTTILATNTSSFSVAELSQAVIHPERFIGLHYFYHAAKNRLVEIIPGPATSAETTATAFRFSIQSGKDPIFTKDAYGFAVNRFFVPWLNEAVKLLEEGIDSMEVIDAICKKVFGIGMGPFALMNATGVPIAMHAQKTLERFGPSYKVAKRLEQQVSIRENWNLSPLETISFTDEQERNVTARMLGVVFFVCSQILQEKVCTAIDLNKGAKIGLKWKYGPVDLLLKYGEEEVSRIVAQYANHYSEQCPEISSSYWQMEFVTLQIKEDRAIITMNRPEDLNALNEEVVKQLELQFTKAEADPKVKTIFLTGSGKAFVAGADIKFFVKNIKNHSLHKIVDFTSYGQSVFEKIDKSPKKVVALLNGMALGGGLELALCADIILAVPTTLMAFPETGIGIYPGLGGTQRTVHRVGKGLAKYLILTGKMLHAADAVEMGLIDEIVTMEELFDLLDGKRELPGKKNIVLPKRWKDFADLYTNNSYLSIMAGNQYNDLCATEELGKLRKTMTTKAPIALRLADELIEEAKGPSSELEKLTTIFSTNDALLGLTSIGKKVEYSGN
jgi:enoyl-CoA hydratase/3-hydroxyacyl-CoA dehydrogenase